MTIFHFFVLSLIQGATEFLPVSSSAHLVLYNKFVIGLQHNLGLDIAMHIGSLMAVVLLVVKPLKQNTDIFLQTIALQSKVIVTIFANPYSINSFLFTANFDGMLLGYQNSVSAQRIVAQSIFGGNSISGSIPVSTRHFDIGDGLNTDSIRLSYSLDLSSSFNEVLEFKIDSIVKNAIIEKAMPGCQILIAKNYPAK